VGTSTDPAKASEGGHFQAHRAKVASSFRDQQVERADAGDDVVEHDRRLRGRSGIPIIASNPRHEDLSPEALLARGYEAHGTPDAPGGRLCRSHGYDDHSDSRHSVCGLPCPVLERERWPHGHQVRGDTPKMSFHDSPRWMGPLQRGTEPWKILSAARTASERTNSADQEGIDNGRPPKLRGLKACRFAGARRTLAHVRRRALTCILDVTYTLGRLRPATT
jgi:hypothetical protein